MRVSEAKSKRCPRQTLNVSHKPQSVLRNSVYLLSPVSPLEVVVRATELTGRVDLQW